MTRVTSPATRMVDNPTRNPAQTKFIERMLFTLHPFFTLRPTMPARVIQTYFLVAQKEGLSVGEYAKRAGISPTTMSRILLDMSETDRNQDEGAGLVLREENAENRREKIYTLTLKGRALLASLTARGEP